MGWFNHQPESMNPSMKICDPVHCSAGFWREGIWFWVRRVICLNLLTIWQMPFCILIISCPLGAPCVINCSKNLHSFCFSPIFFMKIAYLGLPKKYSKTYHTCCFVLQLQTRKLPWKKRQDLGWDAWSWSYKGGKSTTTKLFHWIDECSCSNRPGWKRWWDMFPPNSGNNILGRGYGNAYIPPNKN